MKTFQVIKILHKKTTAKEENCYTTFQHELNIIKQTVVDKEKTPQNQIQNKNVWTTRRCEMRADQT